jgi:hypothetical protein
MPPVVHLVLLVLAFVLFLVDAYQNPGPTRLSVLGFAALVASMITW